MPQQEGICIYKCLLVTMEDLYNRLLEQEDKEARDVALGLEIFVTGALNIFNHQTNINVNNRFIVYGIRDLGESLAPLAMLVMMETIQQKIIKGRSRRWQGTDLSLRQKIWNAKIYTGFRRKIWTG